MGVYLQESQVDALRRHFHHILDRNRVMNLTRVTDPEEALRKLYLASLAVFPVLEDIGVAVQGLFHYLDLGTGAGFPGIPVAVAAPHMETLLIDARRKKTDFLNEVIADLGLPTVRALHVRGADLIRAEPARRESFELVTARAVAPAATIVTEVHDLLSPGGFLAVFKGDSLTEEEVGEGERAARRHGMEFIGQFEQAVEDLRPRVLVYWRGRGDERSE
jgi:16S rRNA (guanine527-N7)-methyltransferase